MSENGRTRFNHSTQKTTGQRLIKSHKNKEIEEVKFDADMERIISKICDSSVLSLWDETCAETKRNLCNVTANEIIDLAINGCSAAETIANNNKQRPLFKNIQFIVAKTRQNVQKPDASVANLHSQGVPWVIRNLIFSFIRILDGWKGVKELLIEKHESFERIENCYYSSNIRQCFVEWQIHTKNMLSHIFDTFENLNSGMQDEMKKYKQYRPDFVNHVEKSQLDNSIQIQYKSQKNIEESIKKSSYTTWQSMDINKINFHHDYLTFPECTSNNVESLSKTDFSSFREISKMYEELGKDFLIDDLKDEFKKRQELNNIKYSARIFVNDKQIHEHEKKSSKNSVFQNNLNKAFFGIFELIKDKVDELDTELSKALNYNSGLLCSSMIDEIKIQLINFNYSNSEDVYRDLNKWFENIEQYLEIYPDNNLYEKFSKVKIEFEKQYIINFAVTKSTFRARKKKSMKKLSFK